MEFEDLKKYLANDEIEKVLAFLLSDNFKNYTEKPLLNEIAIISGRYTDWKKSKLQNSESFENLNIEKQKIRISLIESIDSIIAKTEFTETKEDNFFKQYIEPLHQKVILVHANWVDSFFTYREMVESEESEKLLIEKLLAKISFDSLTSSMNRINIRIQEKIVSKIPKFLQYVELLNQFMRFSEEIDYSSITDINLRRNLGIDFGSSNVPRYYFAKNLYRIEFTGDLHRNDHLENNEQLSKKKRDEIINKIDSVIVDLHTRYSFLEQEYQELKFKTTTNQA